MNTIAEQAPTTTPTPAPIRHLIVALDESPRAQRALPVAIRLAETIGASVELLAVSDEFGPTEPLRQHIEAIANEAGHPVDAWSVVNCSNVPHELAMQRRATEGSLIVMSTHGPTRASGVIANSTVTEVLAEGASVLAVGPRAVARSVTLPIVACVDGSTDSFVAVPTAASLASSLGVPLTLLIVDRPHLDIASTAGASEPAAATAEQVLRDCQALTAPWPGLQVHRHVATYPWNVADALALYLERHPSQLFVVAAHVRSGLARLLHPTTTGQMIRHLAVPVLVVPIPAPPPRVPPSASANPDQTRLTTPYGHVVIPVAPGQPAVDTAVATANSLAAAVDATVVFLTCDDDAARTAATEPARSELIGLLQPTNARWEVVAAADVTAAVIDRARSVGAAIVCLATHAPGRMIDTLMPTTTGRLVRWSPSPVVLVGPHCVASTAPYDEVVACVDGSLISEYVADLAGSWAAAFGVPARILHAVDPDTSITGAPTMSARYTDRLASRVTRRHRVEAHATILATKDAASAIRLWADEHPASILAMASQGEGASESLLGSTVMDVVRNTITPVVVIPAHVLS